MDKQVDQMVRELVSTIRVMAGDTDHINDRMVDNAILQAGRILQVVLLDVHRIADALEIIAEYGIGQSTTSALLPR